MTQMKSLSRTIDQLFLINVVVILCLLILSCTTGKNGLINSYQKSISSVSGPMCPCYPTCSAYCKQAVSNHGVFKGGVYFSRRLISEKDHFRRTSPVININGRLRYHDQVP